MDGALSMERAVRIGCGAGFWGDTPEGPAQLVRAGGIDYLVLDYLAEVTMSILARMKARDPAQGYAGDFVSLVMRPLAPAIAAGRIRVITNAGGINPRACRDALVALFAELGLDLKVALVEGDDLSPRADALRAAGVTEMATGAALPDRLASVNAYLGAFPIARALDRGADVVVTGRCVDSALVLGPLIHEFGWGAGDHDLLSAGSLAGHVIECGTQGTGGIVTDWREVPGWDDMGFPIAICRADGSFEITKPEGTGGRITPMTIAEQITYEVGDPGAYILPDVVCDWRGIRLEQTGPDRVRVSGAQGRPPTDSLKVSATWSDGWRSAVTMMVTGYDAVARAEAVAGAILRRCARLADTAGLAPLSETSVEVLGAESGYGAAARARGSREVVLKIAARSAARETLDLFGREIFPAATAMAQSLTGFAAGRPKPQPVVRLFSFLVPKADIMPVVEDAAGRFEVPFLTADASSGNRIISPEPAQAKSRALRGDTSGIPSTSATRDMDAHSTVPLRALAVARSGDKGDMANIGVVARAPEFWPLIRAGATSARVGDWFAHFSPSLVEQFDWPGLNAVNFLLHGVLGGGGTASLRHDPQGKALAQILLDMPVPVPAAWLAPGGQLAGWASKGLTDHDARASAGAAT